MGVTVTGYKFSLGDDEKFLKLNSCTTLNILKPQEYIFVGWILTHEFYLNKAIKNGVMLTVFFDNIFKRKFSIVSKIYLMFMDVAVMHSSLMLLSASLWWIYYHLFTICHLWWIDVLVDSGFCYYKWQIYNTSLLMHRRISQGNVYQIKDTHVFNFIK